MNKEIKKMIDEFTTNFSDLFVETFLIKYINDYDIECFDRAINVAYTELINKLRDRIDSKLRKINANKKED